jgi:hypothetical protein
MGEMIQRPVRDDLSVSMNGHGERKRETHQQRAHGLHTIEPF